MRITTSGRVRGADEQASGASPGIGQVLDQYRQLEDDGFASAWAGNHLNHDAMTVCALAAGVTSSIELGTGVVPTYTRHPMVMAQQALTTNLAAEGRFTVGIGLSHKFIVESWQGLRWASPARHMREYLSVLMPLLERERVEHEGKEFNVHLNNAPFTQLDVPGAARPQVLVAALGPAMLRVTGALADGTMPYWCGPAYLEKTLIPTITQAAAAAGRADPRVMPLFPIAVTSAEQSARESCARIWETYGQIYSYRTVIAAEGASVQVPAPQ